MKKLLIFCAALSLSAAGVKAANVSDQAQLQTVWTSAPGGEINLVNSIDYVTGLTYKTNASPVTVNGNGFTLNGRGHQLLNMNAAGGTITSANNITFTGGVSTAGGAVYNFQSDWIFNGVTVFENNGSMNYGGDGGAVWSTGGNWTFNSSANFNGNQAGATLLGGAVYSENDNLFLFKGAANFSNNGSFGGRGGAVYNSNTEFIFEKTVNFTSNDNSDAATSSMGGALYSSAGDWTFQDTVNFNGNNAVGASATSGGGAVYARLGSTFDFQKNATFTNNKTNYKGGAIYAENSTFDFAGGAYFANNRTTSATAADSGGGAVFAAENTVLGFGGSSLFEYNSASSYGGAVYLFNNAEMTLENASFISNSAAINGGAVYLSGMAPGSQANLTLLQTDTANPGIFRGNTVNGVSNAVYLNQNSALTFDAADGAFIKMYDNIAAAASNNIIEKTGAGTFELYGSAANYLGDLRVTDGEFNLMNGGAMSAGALTLNSGAGGSPVLGLQNGNVNTLNVSSLNLDSLSELRMDIFSNGTNDLINVSGAADVGGTINVKAGVGSYANSVFTLINSGALTGAFSDFIYLPDTLAHTLDYVGNTVILTVTGGSVTSGLHAYARTFNQKETAKALDVISGRASADMADFINYIASLPDDNSIRAALSRTSPYFLANVISAPAFESEKREIYDKIKNHCEHGKCDASGLWLQGQLSRGVYKADGNSPGDFKNSGGGVLFGYDKYLYGDKILYGFFGRSDKSSLSQGGSTGDISDTGLGAYGGIELEEWDLRALVSGGYDDYSTKRNIPFMNADARAEFNGFNIGADVEAVHKTDWLKTADLRPYFGLEGRLSSYNGFTEKGAGVLDMKVSGGNFFKSAARAGASVGNKFENYGWRVNGELKYILSGTAPEITTAFAEDNYKFKSRGARVDPLVYGLGAGGDYKLARNWELFANLNAELNSDYNSYYGNLGVRYIFPCPPVSKKTAAPVKAAAAPVERVLPIKEKGVARGTTFVIGDGYFETDRHDIGPHLREYLTEKAGELRHIRFEKLVITGHADIIGKEEYNRRLSEARAREVARVFAENGIPASKIEWAGRGYSQPRASNLTEEGRAQNRRVEIYIK